MQASAFNGLAVVSIAGGVKLGTIIEVLFDLTTFRLAALLITSGDRQQFVVPFSAIHTIGPDAVMVPSDQSTQRYAAPFDGLARLDDVVKLKVVDEAGSVLGTVSGIEVDPETREITAVQVHQGGMLGLGGTTTTIPAASIRGVDQLMVVAAEIGKSAAAEPVSAGERPA